jgi:hypothetical protein
LKNEEINKASTKAKRNFEPQGEITGISLFIMPKSVGLQLQKTSTSKTCRQNVARLRRTPRPQCSNDYTLSLPFSAVPPMASSSKQFSGGSKQDRRQFFRGGCQADYRIAEKAGPMQMQLHIFTDAGVQVRNFREA